MQKTELVHKASTPNRKLGATKNSELLARNANYKRLHSENDHTLENDEVTSIESANLLLTINGALQMFNEMPSVVRNAAINDALCMVYNVNHHRPNHEYNLV